MKKRAGSTVKAIKKRRLIIIFSLVAAIMAATILWIAWGNTALQVSTYCISSPDLPESFEGFRIAQVSDLHDAEIGEGNERLIETLKGAEPDIIVMTGDMIDSRRLEDRKSVV